MEGLDPPSSDAAATASLASTEQSLAAHEPLAHRDTRWLVTIVIIHNSEKHLLSKA